MGVTSLQPGSIFGRYRILGRLASGGMGEVWLAAASGPSGFCKKLVLKTILPNLAVHRDYVQMLVDEASVCADMSHPNLVKVFDFGCAERTYFMAMEYLPGRTLAQLMQRVIADHESRIPPWLAATLIAQCCDGLQYAHDFADESGSPLGLVHRDISPSNVMVCFTGNAAVLDFGVATTHMRMAFEDRTVLKGKYAYMAPERIRGESDDRRGDIFALGVVLYQMLTGQRPFSGASDLELFENICAGETTRPRALSPWVSHELEAIVLRALASNPDERYQQTRQFADDLRSYLRASGQDHDSHDVAMFVASHFSDATDLPAAMRPDVGGHGSGTDTDVRAVGEFEELLIDAPVSGELRGVDSVEVEVDFGVATDDRDRDASDASDASGGRAREAVPVAADPHPRSEPVDIFTSHSRRLRKTGDVIARGSSSRPKPYADSEPAFFGARLAPRRSAWAWDDRHSNPPRPRTRTTEDS